MGGAGGEPTARHEGSPSPGGRETLGLRIITSIELIFTVFGGLVFFVVVLSNGRGDVVLLGSIVVGVGLLHVYLLSRLVQLESWTYRWALGLYGVRLVYDIVQVNLLGMALRLFFAAYLFGRRRLFRPES